MRGLIVFILFVGTLFLAGCAAPPPAPKIIYDPVDLGQQRIDLTRQFRCAQYALCDRDVMITPQMIVLHWSRTTTWQQAYHRFKAAHIAEHSALKQYGRLNTSVQFIVARDGTIYELMPSAWTARHTPGLDYISINIDNVGGAANQFNLTQSEVDSDAYLIHVLKRQYPSVDYLIGHYEYNCFRYTPLWKAQEPVPIRAVQDPGVQFMQAVRAKVSDLKLKACPTMQNA